MNIEERLFIQRRKELIWKKLKNLNLTQQDFGKILDHPNKSYISELINGVSPFTLKDLIVINRLLKIDLTDLVPTFLPQSDRVKIRTTIKKLDNPKLKLSKEDLALAWITTTTKIWVEYKPLILRKLNSFKLANSFSG